MSVLYRKLKIHFDKAKNWYNPYMVVERGGDRLRMMRQLVP